MRVTATVVGLLAALAGIAAASTPAPKDPQHRHSAAAVGAGRFSAVLHSFSVGAPLPSTALNALATVLTRRVLNAAGGV